MTRQRYNDWRDQSEAIFFLEALQYIAVWALLTLFHKIFEKGNGMKK